MNRTAIAMLLLTGCQLGSLRPDLEICSAQHSWESYHLAHNALSPIVVNRSGYTPDLAAWNDLETPITLRSSGSGFIITIEEGECPGCLGRASIKRDSTGHTKWAHVTMNRAELDKMKPEAAEHVLCQELGHLLGLDHHKALDSCMDDCSGRADWMACLTGEQGTTPNYHDAEQLKAIYAHAGEGSGPSGPGCTGMVVIHEFKVTK